MNYINFVFLGLGNGAVSAALALALVVTYRSSGVLNFATGSIALYGAYTFAFLRQGQMLFIIPGLPRFYHFDGPVPIVPAFVVAVASSSLLGVVIYVAVFRPIRDARPVAKAVASLGVMQVLTGLISMSVGSDTVVVNPIFPTKVFTFGSVRLNGDRLWFSITIIVLAAGLAAVFRFTRFGLATSAAAETEVGAVISGLKPERLALINWAISAAICGVAGVLIAPLAPLAPNTYTLFIVPALAAAVIGRFSSLLPAVLGGLLIGMAQSEAVFIQSTQKWTLSTGNAELIPLVIVLIALVVKGRPLPTRGMVLQHNLGKSPRPRHVAAGIAVFAPAGLLLLMATSGTTRAAVILSFVMAIISLSLVVVTGYAGQISLAQLTLAGVGGFLLSTLTSHMGVPFPIAPLLGAIGAMVVGVVVGLPAIRIRGLVVGIVTLMLAVSLEAAWFRNSDFNGGGSSGAEIVNPRLFALDLSIGSGTSYPRIQFGITVLIVLIAVATGVAYLRNSRFGAAMLAVRANERSAAAVGLSVVRVKITAFAIGAFIAGLGGAMLAYSQGVITFESYTALGGLGLLTVVFIAGITSISGGIVAGLLAEGGIFYVLIDHNLHAGRWYDLVAGIGLILAVRYQPDGAAGPIHAMLDRRREQRAQASVDSEGPGEGRHRTRPVIPAGAADRGSDVLLEVANLSVRFGGVVAVSDFSLSVRKGEIVGLIGPNGAGKTSTIDAVSGFTKSTGTVLLAGRDLTRLAPHQRVAHGLGRTFQSIDLYEDLSVAENIAVGQYVNKQSKVDAAVARDAILDRLDLYRLAHRNVAELSQGERQLVSIARALASEPEVLLLDEPAAGLDSTESLWLANRLSEIREAGTTIVLVDHDMGLVLGVCDVIHVLDFGQLVASGAASEISSDRRVAEAYLGVAHSSVVGGIK